MTPSSVELVRRGFEAIARGDLDAVGELLAPDARWHGAGGDEGGCRDRAEVVEFMRAALAQGAVVSVRELIEAGDDVIVTLDPAFPDRDDAPQDPHGTLVKIRDGKIVELVVYPDVPSALADAAGTT